MTHKQIFHMDLNDTTNRVIAVIILLLIFIGGWWLIARNSIHSKVVSQKGGSAASSTDVSVTDVTLGDESSATSDVSATTREPVADAAKTTATSEEVTAVDQKAGSTVTVATVTVAQTSWVAVRTADNRILGAARLEAGSYTDVSVELLRATEAGQTYTVVVYTDDGDKMFDIHKDSLVAKADGSDVSSSFVAQ